MSKGCPTLGCGGDPRYAAPGRGHVPGCRYPVGTNGVKADDPIPKDVLENRGKLSEEFLDEASIHRPERINGTAFRPSVPSDSPPVEERREDDGPDHMSV